MIKWFAHPLLIRLPKKPPKTTTKNPLLDFFQQHLSCAPVKQGFGPFPNLQCLVCFRCWEAPEEQTREQALCNVRQSQKQLWILQPMDFWEHASHWSQNMWPSFLICSCAFSDIPLSMFL